MEHIVEVLKIIEGGLKQDNIKVKNYANLLASKLDQEGEKKLSDKIFKLTEGNASLVLEKATNANHSIRMPLDQESRLSMVEIRSTIDFKDTVFLNLDATKKIDRFFEIYKNTDKILSRGLSVPTSLLLYGPPGTGKTMLANYIGHVVGLPVVIARLDALISSFLGSTSRNIRTIFEYVNKTPCVLFLDEFDAIAKLRDDRNELGELKRVVNSLLQNIDTLGPNTILVAATNHEQLLDSAVWRRFSYKVELQFPTFETRINLIQSRLNNCPELQSLQIENLAYLFENLNGANIERIVTDARIMAIIRDEMSTLQIDDIVNSFFEHIEMEPKYQHNAEKFPTSLKDKVIFIRNINEKIFSYKKISELLGVSKSIVQKYLSSNEGGIVNGREKVTN